MKTLNRLATIYKKVRKILHNQYKFWEKQRRIVLCISKKYLISIKFRKKCKKAVIPRQRES